MMAAATKPKGAASRAAVSAEHRAQLEAGLVESRSLSELLVMDLHRLLQAVAPAAARLGDIDPTLGITARMQLAANLLHGAYGNQVAAQFSQHTSDTVRGLVAYTVALQPDQSPHAILSRIQAFANDHHFGVREWAWLAVRNALASQLSESILLLTPWTHAASANLRRFASEVLRPRGVWCTHIRALRTQPELGLPILQPLCADPARYVQDSVANWLNDASKDQPDWVRKLCLRWQQTSLNAATAYICKRAQRSIG